MHVMIRHVVILAGLAAAFGLALAQPAPAPPRPEKQVVQAWIGVYLGDVLDGGVRVMALVPGGPAARGGVKVGDVILEFNGEAVTDRNTVTRLLGLMTPGEPVTVGLLRDRAIRETIVKTGRVYRDGRTELEFRTWPQVLT